MTTESIVMDIRENISDYQSVLNQLGGTKKIACVTETPQLTEEDFFQRSIEFTQFEGSKRVTFGISVYGQHMFSVKDMGMKLKRYIKGKGRSCRFVRGDNHALSTVQVSKNDLTGPDGREIIYATSHRSAYIGQTVAVQDFEAYAIRDYHKPVRDQRKGMLPPKLAQIMLNLARIKKDGCILDPFCGTGTIPGEALLHGYQVIASDSDQSATDATTKNIQFLNDHLLHQLKVPITVDPLPVDQVASIVPRPIDAVVTEGTLGPLYRRSPSPKEASHVFRELHNIYHTAFLVFSSFLKSGGYIVITLPFYRLTSQNMYFPEEFIAMWEKDAHVLRQHLIPKYICQRFQVPYGSRLSLAYERPEQIVGREIMVFQKISQ